ncbi:AGAP000743-PA-like protein [Anopheles sinensis]|uniref:AGAP000743-PA-like protein n=1 Tax=Anopheles sinensis TaxID=74873 RepID=A0A084VVH0_ANOSI|nr:AGAP000743-PA-like protein [Anopheles sinensis]
MLQLAFRSFFFIAVILGYSTGIWRLINDYFRHEFQSYLEQESQTNKYLLRDPPGAGAKVVLPGGPTFPAGATEGEASRPPEAATAHRTVTDSISEFSNPIAGGTDFLPSPVVAGKKEAGKETTGKMATEAAEVTDIRRGNGEEEGTAEEDKWIAYWQHRGKGSKGGAVGSEAFCSIGRNPSGPPETSMEEETEECAGDL